jgi:hypothetical protein
MTSLPKVDEGTPAFGVAQQVIHQRYESLSPKQRKVYDAVVGPALEKRHEQLEMHRRLGSNPD